MGLWKRLTLTEASALLAQPPAVSVDDVDDSRKAIYTPDTQPPAEAVNIERSETRPNRFHAWREQDGGVEHLRNGGTWHRDFTNATTNQLYFPSRAAIIATLTHYQCDRCPVRQPRPGLCPACAKIILPEGPLCPRCEGAGKYNMGDCDLCRGTGLMSEAVKASTPQRPPEPQCPTGFEKVMEGGVWAYRSWRKGEYFVPMTGLTVARGWEGPADLDLTVTTGDEWGWNRYIIRKAEPIPTTKPAAKFAEVRGSTVRVCGYGIPFDGPCGADRAADQINAAVARLIADAVQEAERARDDWSSKALMVQDQFIRMRSSRDTAIAALAEREGGSILDKNALRLAKEALDAERAKVGKALALANEYARHGSPCAIDILPVLTGKEPQ